MHNRKNIQKFKIWIMEQIYNAPNVNFTLSIPLDLIPGNSIFIKINVLGNSLLQFRKKYGIIYDESKFSIIDSLLSINLDLKSIVKGPNNKLKYVPKNGLIIEKNGDKVWYKDDLLHHENGPAVEHSNGTKYWCIDGKQHRLDGPAAEYANGTKFWYINGKQHRLAGPASEYAGGEKYWYYQGQRIECSSQEEFKQLIKLKPIW